MLVVFKFAEYIISTWDDVIADNEKIWFSKSSFTKRKRMLQLDALLLKRFVNYANDQPIMRS